MTGMIGTTGITRMTGMTMMTRVIRMTRSRMTGMTRMRRMTEMTGMIRITRVTRVAFHLSELTAQPIPIIMRISIQNNQMLNIMHKTHISFLKMSCLVLVQPATSDF